MKEWINTPFSIGWVCDGLIVPWDADLTEGMLKGQTFDNDVVYIDNGAPPKQESREFIIEGELFYCSQDCVNCKCYDCKLEGL